MCLLLWSVARRVHWFRRGQRHGPRRHLFCLSIPAYRPLHLPPSPPLPIYLIPHHWIPGSQFCLFQLWNALLWREGLIVGRGALNSGCGPSVLWSRSSHGCCAAWSLGPAIAGPALSLLWVPSFSVLKPYLGEQKADRHIRSLDCPVQRAGASVVPIRKPAWPPSLWSVRPSVAPAGLFSENESLDPGK